MLVSIRYIHNNKLIVTILSCATFVNITEMSSIGNEKFIYTYISLRAFQCLYFLFLCSNALLDHCMYCWKIVCIREEAWIEKKKLIKRSFMLVTLIGFRAIWIFNIRRNLAIFLKIFVKYKIQMQINAPRRYHVQIFPLVWVYFFENGIFQVF